MKTKAELHEELVALMESIEREIDEHQEKIEALFKLHDKCMDRFSRLHGSSVTHDSLADAKRRIDAASRDS